MKYNRLLVSVLCLGILFAFTGCKSKTVKECEKKISAIGEVSIDSYSDIEAANEAYESLSADEKVKVSNYSELTDAQIRYVEVLIDEIDEVTLDNENEIIEAREAYDGLDTSLRNDVSNYNLLEDAEEELEELRLLDITGTWTGTFMGIEMNYVFNSDGTMYNYTNTEGVNGTASGNYTYDGTTLHLATGSDIPMIRRNETTLVMTATGGGTSIDIVLTRQD